MDKISIIFIIGSIVLLTSTSLIFANPPDKVVSELKKEERKRLEKAANKRRNYMALMYIWESNKR